MCGIFGTIHSPVEADEVFARLRHRGPDERGTTTFGPVQLFHLRLAIQAISCGAQPMHLDQRYSIVYNGEIYNNADVVAQLGLACDSPSDTETLLRAFAKMDFGALDYVDGMFAFAILDREERKIHFARDRAGKRPLYFYHDGARFAFTSELNALRATIPLEIDSSNVTTALRFGYNFGTNTPYKHVTELAPGHCATIDIDKLSLTTRPWWLYDSTTQRPADGEPEALSRVDGMLRTAVQRRMATSDLEVGCFLSGGIDSGIITAMASEIQPELRTFTIRFKGTYDESALAQLVSERYNTRHHVIDVDFRSLPNEIERIIAAPGEPLFDSSLIPSYYVSRAARQFVTVALNGDGADELFGGYRRYVPFKHIDIWSTSTVAMRLLRSATKLIPPGSDKRSLRHRLSRLARASVGSPTELYLKATTDIFEDTDFTPHLPISAEVTDLIDGHVSARRSALQALIDLDFHYQLPGDLLVKMDIASMSHSLEGRSPLLCKELLDYVPTLPDDYKIRGVTTKYLLRQLANRYLPSTLIDQPKRGFEVPLKSWTDGVLKEAIFSYLTPQSYVATVVPYNLIDSLKNQPHRFEGEKRAKMLWALFAAEVWHARVYTARDYGLTLTDAK